MFDPFSMGMSVLGGILGNRSKRKAEARAQAANEANIRAMLASISQGKSAQLPYLEKILGIAEQRVGEEGRVAAGYDKAGKQLETGHKRGMARLAGAEGQMQELMQSMMQTALGGAIGNAPMMAMGGGSMGANLARMAAGDVMQSGAPLDIAKAAAAAESTYGTRQAGLTTEKTGATATAREGYRSGMQGALGGFADLEKWATDATVKARSGIQYQAGGGDGGGAQMGANLGMLLGMMGDGPGLPPVYGAQAPGMPNRSADPTWAGYQWWGSN
jgi:hypothetical protein